MGGRAGRARAEGTVIWHNPRCTKSRQTLALLREHGVEPTVREYLNDPPSAAEIRAVLGKLGTGAAGLVRRKEAAFNEANLATASGPALVDAMAANPILIERPVVIRGARAALGRPPESVLPILE